MALEQGLNRLDNLLESQRRLQGALIRSQAEARDPNISVAIEVSIAACRDVIANVTQALADIRANPYKDPLEGFTLSMDLADA